MAVITLARQVGSGGSSIASALADRLGYRVFDRHALREEALRLGLTLPLTFESFAREDRAVVLEDEGPPRLYVGYGELEFDQAILGRDHDPSPTHFPSFLDTLSAQRRDILIALHAVVYRLAALDRVIFVGAGTQILLGGLTGMLRAKIVADELVRASRLSVTYGLPPDDALGAVRRSDQEQRDYNKAIYGADWDDPLLWDVVVNTDHVTVADASAWLAGLVGRSPYDDRLSDDATASLRVAADVNLQLAKHGQLRSKMVFAAPAPGVVVLHGEVATPADRDEVLKMAEALSGRLLLRDELVVLGGNRLLHRDQRLSADRR